MNFYKGVIKNGRIWTGNGFICGDVGFDKGVITHLGGEYKGGGWYEFDAKGAIVTAGLVDIHTHLQSISGENIATPAESGCYPFGVTTVCDASGDTDDKEYFRKNSLDISTFAFVPIADNHADLKYAERTVRALGEYAIGLKTYCDTAIGGIFDKTPLLQTCEYAKKHNLKVMVHTTNSPIPAKEIVQILSKGDVFTHIYHGGKNNTSEDNFAAFKLAAEKGVIMDSGLAGGVHTDFKVAKRCIEAGYIPDTISTDLTCCSAFIRGGRYGMMQAMSMLRYLGMSEEQLLLSVTENAARAIGKSDTCGKLAVGKRADIAVINYSDIGFDISDNWGNSISHNKGYECLLTMKNGCVVHAK